MMGRGFGYGFGGYEGYGYWCGVWMPIIFAIIVIGFIIYLIMKRPRKHKEDPNSQALAILNERLAKGEITEEEYEKVKKAIHH